MFALLSMRSTQSRKSTRQTADTTRIKPAQNLDHQISKTRRRMPSNIGKPVGFFLLLAIVACRADFKQDLDFVLAVDDKQFVMSPATVYADIDRLIHDNNGMDLSEVQEIFAENLETNFQRKVQELKQLLAKKEACARRVMANKEFENIKDAEKWIVKRYIGRVADLDSRNYELAKAHWGKCNKKTGRFMKAEVGNDGIRQGHMNVLAIGLSNETSGFGFGFKAGTKKFPFIREAKKLGLIPSNLTRNQEQGRADNLSKLMNVRENKGKFESKKGWKLVNADLPDLLDKDIKKQITTLTNKYYNWTQTVIVTQEEMDLFLSNSRPGYVEHQEEPNDIYIPRKTVDEVGVTYRMGRILTMLLRQKLDVMTLVELDCYDFFANVLSKFGYEGTFQEKMGLKGNDIPGHEHWIERDGGAIFWLKSKFTAEKPESDCIQDVVHTAEYKKFNKNTFAILEGYGQEDEEKHAEYPKLELNKQIHHNIYLGPKCHGKQLAIDVILRCRNNGKKIAILTGHLKSGNLVKDIENKATIMEFVGERIKFLEYETGVDAVILSGDLNTPPDGKLRTLGHLEDVLDGALDAGKDQQLSTDFMLQKREFHIQAGMKLKVEVNGKKLNCKIKNVGFCRQKNKTTYTVTIMQNGKKHIMEVKQSDLWISRDYYSQDLKKHVINRANRKCKMTSVYPEQYLTKFTMRVGGSQPHKLKWQSEVEDYLMSSKGMRSTALMWYGEEDAAYGDFAPTNKDRKEAYFGVAGGAPNGRLPSDHVMLATVWQFTNIDGAQAVIDTVKSPGNLREQASIFQPDDMASMRRKSNIDQGWRTKTRKFRNGWNVYAKKSKEQRSMSFGDSTLAYNAFPVPNKPADVPKTHSRRPTRRFSKSFGFTHAAIPNPKKQRGVSAMKTIKERRRLMQRLQNDE